MKIQEITNYSTAFRAKSPLTEFFNAKKLNENLNKIQKNEDTKELFKGLSALAASVVAGITIAAEKNDDAKEFLNKVINDLGLSKKDDSTQVEPNNTAEIEEAQQVKEESIDISELLEDNPKRKTFLKITSYFPNLDKEYKKMLETMVKEPDNTKNDFTLDMIENIFDYLSQQDRLMGVKSYFQALNEKADVLNDISTNISSTLKNGNSLMYYMVLLNNGKLTNEDIKLWAKTDNLSCDEFMTFKSLGSETILNLSNIKNQYNNKFKVIELNEHEKNDVKNNFLYKLDFEPDVELAERFKIVKDIHEALHGKVCFDANKDEKSEYVEHDIQRELLDNVIKDRRMDATFTFVKYINPASLKDYNLTAQDVKFLSKDDKKYKEIYKICMENVMHLDFENPRFKELCEIMKDDKMFGELLESNHSRMRFLTRFVLKNNPTPKNLRESCKQTVSTFYDELKDNSDKCNYFCYFHTKGTAPQFYLGKSSLGNYIKITLNSEGKIHTMYEDIRKETKGQ